MNGLWILVAVLGLAALAFLLLPLRRRRDAPARRADYDLGVYRDQLREVERDRDRGLLTDDQAEAAVVEIQRRILAVADDGGDGETAPQARRPSVRAVAVAAVAAPAAAVGLYLVLGQPTLPDQPVAGRAEARRGADDPHTAPGARGEEMEMLVGRLAERLRRRPDDVDGWVLLGRTYVTLARRDDAVDAYRRALAASGDHPGIAADLGEALISRADGIVDLEAQRLFKAALAADPRTIKARYYLGVAKAQSGDLQGAVDAWVDLVAVSPPAAPWLVTVRQQIGQAAERLGIETTTLKPSAEALALGPPPAAAPSPAASGPGREDLDAAAEMSVEERAEMIRGMVQRLAARLESNPNDRQGWLRLGRAYRVLGEAEKARRAFDRAEALGE